MYSSQVPSAHIKPPLEYQIVSVFCSSFVNSKSEYGWWLCSFRISLSVKHVVFQF